MKDRMNDWRNTCTCTSAEAARARWCDHAGPLLHLHLTDSLLRSYLGLDPSVHSLPVIRSNSA